MRYQEAYELIQVSLDSQGLVTFPITEKLKAQFFDNIVKDIAYRVVRKVNMESFSASGDNLTFTNPDYSGQVYKVELISSNTSSSDSKSVIPFIPESAMINDDDDNVTNVGYFLKTDISRDNVDDDSAFGGASGSTNTLTVESSSDHGLVTGDYVILSEIIADGSGAVAGNQAYYDEFINGKRFSITKTDADTFTVSVTSNSTAAAAIASDTVSGQWVEDSKKIYFSKDVSGTVKVYYYAAPEAKNSVTSRIDLPDQLIPAAIHSTVGHFLDLGGSLQLGAGHRALAAGLEADYLRTSRAKEAMQDILPLPLQDFVL
tara:strand:+ start:66 stop:1016 length:951 start_codon:yes stop_codon:yes gene_type:complete